MERVERLERRAGAIIKSLRPHCSQIEIAGSLRRGVTDAKDIDIVLVPMMIEREDLFGNTHLVAPAFLDDLSGVANAMGLRYVRGGDRLRTYVDPSIDAAVEISIVQPPQQFGAIFAIRTGPFDFIRRCVTSKLDGGAMPVGMRQENGALWRGQTLIETRTEASWFAALGLPLLAPAARSGAALEQGSG